MEISKMPNSYFKFKRFVVFQDKTAMKVTTDACLFGAWCAAELSKLNTENQYALDIGTGTGLLSMMVAQKTKLQVDANEIDEYASQQAKENFKASPFADSIALYHNDIVKHAKAGYDFIFSNPPFYENDLISPADVKNVAHHSTNLTWQQLFLIISKKLKDTGLFFLLLPFKRKNEIEDLLKKNSLHIHQWIEVKPTDSHSPFRIMISGGKMRENIEIKEIVIKNKEAYSNDFIELLKDYYLYL